MVRAEIENWKANLTLRFESDFTVWNYFWHKLSSGTINAKISWNTVCSIEFSGYMVIPLSSAQATSLLQWNTFSENA